MKLFIANEPYSVIICGGTRPRNFPAASSHKALYLQSVRPIRKYRYPYGSFAEYTEECIRGNNRGRLINACVVGISMGKKEKNPFGFEQKIHSAPSCEVRKV